MTTSTRARLRERQYTARKYPQCWPRASRIIRRLANGICQRCGLVCNSLEVHHIGSPYADGRAGDPHDKHDIRPENLTAICFTCHDEIEHVGAIRRRQKTRRKKRRARVEAHRALGVGTGLVLYQPDQEQYRFLCV
jgi:5-methylcytosine-specific restriction endonuclease McrA